MGLKRRLAPGIRPTWKQQLTYFEFECLSEIWVIGDRRLRALAAEMEVPLDGIAQGAICLAAEIIATIDAGSLVKALTGDDIAKIAPRVLSTKRATRAQVEAALLTPSCAQRGSRKKGLHGIRTAGDADAIPSSSKTRTCKSQH